MRYRRRNEGSQRGRGGYRVAETSLDLRSKLELDKQHHCKVMHTQYSQ